ncbi:protein of unknown function [Rhodovastum atsumiense]|nr:protein of unknown function [Rhodovastum atsumiense]
MRPRRRALRERRWQMPLRHIFIVYDECESWGVPPDRDWVEGIPCYRQRGWGLYNFVRIP